MAFFCSDATVAFNFRLHVNVASIITLQYRGPHCTMDTVLASQPVARGFDILTVLLLRNVNSGG